ncbi:segregation/condensation protein A [Synechococcales cyanobacterium C]|uniref:Segregation and condensation protein A n=1 Tax=Petrachloros mirabilis ULC683 TaxID=2781853 RepID=A0A8K2A6N0_9CYAN|nr:segregation/condensation protein A [Petrachloros mirabilis]NCJ06036.1 segregation/condensation protein A [Petrachloros mirabilis ULC683]
MPESFADNAIALLIDLAQRGEVDPWDVNVIDVFDRFLNELTWQDSQELSTSGQAFLYASMLVLLKAESLAETQSEPDLDSEDLELDLLEDELGLAALPTRLEQHLHRRPVAPPPSRRRVTLGDLIQQLEMMATAVERQSQRGRPVKVRRISKTHAAKAIAQLAHPENLSEVAAELEALLMPLRTSQEWLDLEALLKLKNDRVGVFWALLLLCAQSKVELDQSEFYHDLRLRPISEVVHSPALGA